jgi:hypothetical protein
LVREKGKKMVITGTRTWPTRCPWLLLALSILFSLFDKPVGGGRLAAQEGTTPGVVTPEARVVARTFQSGQGVRIDVSATQGDLSEEEMAEALEKTAQGLRTMMQARSSPEVKALPAPQTTVATNAKEVPPADAGTVATLLLPAIEVADSEGHDAGQSHSRFQCIQFPPTLLWEPPLANPLEPRMYLKPTTLSNIKTSETLDTAIGGTMGLFRVSPADDANVGFEQDFFAVVFSRFATYRTAVAVDYRFGFPLTFAWGNWEAKIGYEHTSTHLGDEFMQWSAMPHIGHVRDEAVLGLAYRFWDAIRLYGIVGYAFQTSAAIGSANNRFDWGIEWNRRRTTGWRGQPFAAFDMEVRADQDYTPNVTGQIGWEWRNIDSRAAIRIALELHDGDSPFGEFTKDHERWVGVGLFLDF